MEHVHAFSYHDDWASRDNYGNSRGQPNLDGRPATPATTNNRLQQNVRNTTTTTNNNNSGNDTKESNSDSGTSTQKKKKKKKGAVRIFQRFAEKCSMQGPPYINASTWWFSRTVWTLLLILALGAMSYHLYYLCKVYFDWPIKNTLSMGFSSLQFPSVTVCNVNPVRSSQVSYLSQDLQMFLRQVDPKAIGGIIDNLPGNTNTNTTTTNSTTTTTATATAATSGRRKRKRREATNDVDDVDVDDDDNEEEEEEEEEHTQLDDIDFGQSNNNFTNGREEVNDNIFQDLEGYGDSWEKEAKQSSFSLMDQTFRELYSTEKRVSRVRAGHKINDMLLSCSFAGKSCYPRNFTLVPSSTFGNCYTLQYSKFVSRASGPNGGLELLFFLDTEEYIRGITPDDGLQVTIHQQGTVPFPVDEGLAVASGSNTKLALKLFQIKRKGQPYGNCSDITTYMKTYGVMYSRQTCYKFCEQGEVHKSCNCRDETADDINILMNMTSLKPCRSTKDVGCLRRAQWRSQSGKVRCSCFNPCSESKFEKTMSARPWPDEEYAKNVLVKTACKRLTAQKCQQLQAKPSHEIPREFVKLSIFYEDLNYENITEEPDYETVQFISDVGGTLGLWIGLSVLSIMEVCQLPLELIRHICCCRWTR